ncbi:hypothetical protein EVAR_62658_1 [Eumeta japonica]|uniref:Uncharacterized protein n=1 Tax=Eumeta variegata TaxID=151549 RepID=A0A4C1Z3E6_EUMVA|nr:hypothetical protein EVAR_62658_1 [Eumeta japonica]
MKASANNGGESRRAPVGRSYKLSTNYVRRGVTGEVDAGTFAQPQPPYRRLSEFAQTAQETDWSVAAGEVAWFPRFWDAYYNCFVLARIHPVRRNPDHPSDRGRFSVELPARSGVRVVGRMRGNMWEQCCSMLSRTGRVQENVTRDAAYNRRDKVKPAKERADASYLVSLKEDGRRGSQRDKCKTLGTRGRCVHSKHHALAPALRRSCERPPNKTGDTTSRRPPS